VGGENVDASAPCSIRLWTCTDENYSVVKVTRNARIHISYAKIIQASNILFMDCLLKCLVEINLMSTIRAVQFSDPLCYHSYARRQSASPFSNYFFEISSLRNMPTCGIPASVHFPICGSSLKPNLAHARNRYS
jgi:hypothetical protein